ncbi:MAG: sortase [Actinomycetota bacterium]
MADVTLAAPRRVLRVRADAWRTPVTVLLATVAVASLWFVGFGRVLSGVEAHRAQANLRDAFRAQLATGEAPAGNKPVVRGAPVAQVTVAALGLRDAIVVEGTTSAELARAVGHRRDTVLPGEEGTSVLLGRSTLFDAAFAGLSKLLGQPISVTTGEGTFRYRVDRVRRAGERTSPPLKVGQGRLTMISSERVPGSYSLRAVYADATLIGTPAPPSVGRPTSVLTADETMRGDPRALLTVLLWLEAMIVAAAGIVAMRARWRSTPLLLVASPVMLALLWGAMDAAARLLPNVY